MSNSTLTKKAVKKALMGAAILATSPAWAKGDGGVTEGGKNQLGVNHLSLDEIPGRNTILCRSPESVETKSGSNITPNEITVAVNPFDNSYFEIVFHVRDILAHDTDHILFLVYSPKMSPTPQIPTPSSINKLKLDLSALEILAVYQIPQQNMLAQDPTRIGRANPAPHSEVSFGVNLDTEILPTFMRNNEKAYLQAALLSAKDFGSQKFDNMILSEMDTIEFKEMECPEQNASMGMSDEGTLTVTDSGGDVLKTTVTASSEASATTITK